MKITDMLQEYHSMPACDRLDLLCRMLRHCVPYEARFLGTILLDEARSHFKNHISKMETNANRVSYYSSMQDGGGLTHEVCEKLCCALAVLRSNNHPVAEIIFNMLNDSRVMSRFEETSDLRVLQDFRLLYVMAVNHPALLFNQRQHLMYTYLQRMDLIFLEKCKYSFSGSFSGSMEKTLSLEVENGKYPPEGHFKEISPDAYIVRCEVHSVYKRTTDKRYAYMIQVEWSDGTSYSVRRTYGDFFSFQTKLLDLFPEEGGQKGKKHPRLIPYLPGKNYSNKFLKNKDVAEKRLPELHRYSRELVSLPDRVTRCAHVLEFFKPKPTDMKEDYPAFHKITTLYDLVESGKVRSRIPLSDPLKGSPSSSPALHRGSPLQRAMHDNTTTPTDPTPPSRSSHTLPPVSSSTQQVNHEATPVITRRPTYPLTRHLQKSETSAFTPVGKSALSEDELTSTATLTASVMSIPESAASLQTTPTLSQATPTLSSELSKADGRFVFASSTSMGPDCIPVLTPPVMSSGETTSAGGHADATTAQPGVSLPSQQLSRNPAVSAASGVFPVATSAGSTATSAQQAMSMSLWRQIQMEIAPTTQVGVSGGLSSISPTQHVSSPTSISPLLTSTFSPPLPLTSPSPTHSGASTPRSLTYPQPMLYPHPQFNPVYYISTSPLPSPLASPKTSSKWRGSYSSVSECDSLLKWLKSLRLHKYHTKFENLTYEEFCQMTVEEFEGRGMTTGAAKKLHKKLEELKMCNFGGFRDMPFSAGMTRKLSTCSLPAALLMEQTMTPSSSYDRFSPTGSTCSLDKYGHTAAVGGGGSGDRRTLTSAHGYRSAQEVRSVIRHSSNSEPPPSSSAAHINCTLNGIGEGGEAKMVDGAILKTVSSAAAAKSAATNPPPRISDPPAASRSGISTANSSAEKPSCIPATSNEPGGIPPATTSQTAGGLRATGNGSPSGQRNSSWADTAEGEEGIVSRPDWAQLPNSNGETHSSSIPGSKVQSHAGSVIRQQPGVAPAMGMQYQVQHHHPRSSVPSPRLTGPSHPPIHGYHANHPRNLHESSHNNAVMANSTDIIIPQPLHPAMTRHQAGGANWNKSVHLHQTPMTIVPNQQQQRTGHHNFVLHNQNNSSANGLMRGPFLAQNRSHGGGGGILVFPPVSMVGPYPVGGHGHPHPPPPVACYNCGKRGHPGNTCPGVTMDDSDASSFHKQLERLVDDKAAH